MPQMYGKYRGIVTDNIDPLSIGRVQVMAPAVLGEAPSWALPCSPFAGPDVGLCLIPPVGANVWVEFEGGDTGSPIWSGCFWGAGEYPAEAKVEPPEKVQVLKGYGFKLVANSVGPTGLTIEVGPPMLGRTLRIVLDDNGIVVSNQDEMELKLTESQIELIAQQSSKLTMSAEEVVISNPMSKIEMSGSRLDLTNGGASVKISPATVNVNNGALEVL
jgi:Type VI secretion system/phage-baseplate injector OB domain